MLSRVLPFAVATGLALALTIANTHAGGWAVVTVEDLPERIVVGAPTELKFSVRQHGIRLVPGLNGWISAVADGLQVDAKPVADEPGYYRASLTIPRAGQWKITISSGFGVGSAVTLMPIRAAAVGEPHIAVSLPQRGQELFVAKGCNSCHYHGDTKAQPRVRVAEDLTEKRYSDQLLTMMLTNPAMIPKRSIWEMPDLKLRPQELAALVAFINKPRTRP